MRTTLELICQYTTHSNAEIFGVFGAISLALLVPDLYPKRPVQDEWADLVASMTKSRQEQDSSHVESRHFLPDKHKNLNEMELFCQTNKTQPTSSFTKLYLYMRVLLSPSEIQARE